MLKNMEGDMGGNRWKDMDGYGALWNVMWNNMDMERYIVMGMRMGWELRWRSYWELGFMR